MSSRRALAIRPLPLAPLASALAALLLGITSGACERRIDEPLPLRPRSDLRDGPGLEGTPPSPVGAPPSPVAAQNAGRCIHPTPATPVRPPPARPGPDPACPEDPTGPLQLATGKVIFLEAKAPDVLVEIARKERERARGLMYRKNMPEDRGMIFVFEQRTNHSFWMHNTCLPLDMLFIDRDGTIVGIEENTPTLNDSTFQVGCPSTYVLELNAGWARRHGVVAGQKVRLEGI
ncbi:uncharacterized protein SOCE26_053480 [Sorangium cellulosum]|uniref:Uncharacterized protein n=1 Tax=Sorangium cellulosum TaxID=56 RepID=A0A2L0EX58_SORCE|nr:DUF192 domain-containing protein [Sorangium cellulosum]AUX43892.1 uncharacterized protein SOCE26_053480 [Sorangium cellulosum]